MKTDFDNLRKWRRAQVMLAIVLIVQGVTGLVELSMGKGAEASIALISRLVNPYVASALAIDSLAGGGLALFISSQIMDALNEAVKACSCD